jgi:hypothetical protein
MTPLEPIAVLPDRGLSRQLAATFSADGYWLHRTAVWPNAYNDLLNYTFYPYA